jgi:hypothetical protein
MYGYGQIEPCRQTTLLHKRLALLGDPLLTPIVVKTYLTHGAELHAPRRLREVMLHQSQLLTPARVIVHRCRVQTHHSTALARLAHKVEQTLVTKAVDGRQQQALHACLTGTQQSLGPVLVELLAVKVRMCIYQSHNNFSYNLPGN